jgi:hypothetical protein
VVNVGYNIVVGNIGQEASWAETLERGAVAAGAGAIAVVGCRVPEPRESVKRLQAAAGVTLPAVPSRPPAARVATTRRLPSRRKSK